MSGSAIEWLVEDTKLLPTASMIDEKCKESTDNQVIVVPALAGFAAPYWDSDSRGTVFGLSRHTSESDLIRATVDGIAHTVVDLLELISEMTGTPVSTLAVDGGLSRSNCLQQATADFLGATVERTSNAAYVTARGVAWMAGIKRGLWSSFEDAMSTLSIEATFEPKMSADERAIHRASWKDAVSRSLNWKPKAI